MQKVKIGSAEIYMAFAVLSEDLENINSRPDAVIVDLFDRSQQILTGAVSGINKGIVCCGKSICSYVKEPFGGKIVDLKYGKERVSNALAYSPLIRQTKAFIIRKGSEYDSFYSYIMKYTPIPMIRELVKPLLDHLVSQRLVGFNTSLYGITPEEAKEWMYELADGSKCKLSELVVMRVSEKLTEQYFAEAMKMLYEKGLIKLTDKQQKPFEVSSIDKYFEKYGQDLVNEVDDVVVPKIDLIGSSEEYALKTMRPFPQQNAIANGAVAGLKDRSFQFLNCGMGVGKTLMAFLSIEIRGVRKYMNTHKGATLQSAYSSRDNINYRVVVLCPGTIVKKWGETIRDNIPYAKVHYIDTLADAIAIKDKGAARNGREFYVISKDTAKLSCSYRPAIGKITRRRVPAKYVCAECGATKEVSGNVKCACGGNHWVQEFRLKCSKCGRYKPDKMSGACGCGGNWLREPVSYKGQYTSGCTCPECDNLLWDYSKSEHYFPYENPLQPEDFGNRTNRNSNCYVCGASLWTPNVGNLGSESSAGNWRRVLFYADMKKSKEKTAWCYAGREAEFEEANGVKIIGNSKESLLRKIAISTYMKKQLKGFFDYLIADECHLYKGGNTGQAQSFCDLVSITKKQLLLTGTLINGYATSLFYLLYRVAPWLMKKKGYEWTDEMKFAKKYGVIKQEFEKSGDDIYLQNCRGKAFGNRISVQPGCSPLVIKELLLPYQLCLDLSDLSQFLPPLYEDVVSVPLEPEILAEYHRVNDKLQYALKTPRGRRCMSDKLQFSLSYVDKPFGRQPILSGEDGKPLVSINNFEEYADEEIVIKGYDKRNKPIWQTIDKPDFKLLNKEKELIKLVESELSEDRNCVIYVEYSSSPMTNITGRLKKILAANVKGLDDKEIMILKSASPSPKKREEWIHKQAAKGMRVMICNPRCVEVGLDFCFSELDAFGNKVDYNYPTLIFYQCGYNLFTLWQASRRSYRLCQTEECRTYYFASEDTVQMDVLQIMAEKQVAAQAIQGKFSEAGLAAMCKTVDAKVRLAQALAGKTKIDKRKLKDLFDCSNRATNSMSETEKKMLADYKPQPIFEEIMGGLKYSEDIAEEIKIVDMASLINSESMSVQMMNSIGDILKGVEVEKVKNSHTVGGQVNLFAILGATV